jgi:plastocyanin
MARHAARTVRRRVAIVAAVVLVVGIAAVVILRIVGDDPEAVEPSIGGGSAPVVSIATSLDPTSLAPGEQATARVRMSADREVRVSELAVRFGRVDGGGSVPSVGPRKEFWVGILTGESTFEVTFDKAGTYRYWVDCQLADGRTMTVSAPGTIRVR